MSKTITAAVAFATVVAACGSGAGTASPGATPTPPHATSASSTAPGSGFDASTINVDLEPVVDIPGAPLAIATPRDGSGRLFVVDQGGQIWIVRDGKRSDTPFLDISSRISSGGEQGLLGLAFHPGFATDKRFYLDYTNPDGDTVVSEWRVASADATTADTSSERVLLTVDQPFANHNGGAVVFGPDGFLYISLGDGGSAGDPQGNGQKLDTHLAKLLRIDVDTKADGRAYGIPASNPFATRSGARPEIYVFGMRNPWRISFDRANGDLWIGDVGQGAWEEIDVVRAGSGGGENFGWNRTEGFHCYPGGDSCDRSGLTDPVTEYAHDLGCSVTGGVVYRGKAYPMLAGVYLFGDYCSGNVWAIDAAASRVDDPAIVAETGRSISSFGEDDAGEVYATDLAGTLLKVVAESR
ncbi:MAG TPA: PQQ-dependent sugar dehydrogenase [Candidatus Limnocylindrales bacterium]|nr:PQQ-dependent sugar dehydrogenase [Candidatus Limnocylindrales bacterium]